MFLDDDQDYNNCKVNPRTAMLSSWSKRPVVCNAQCSGEVFNLDKKFRSQNCLF